MSTRENTRLIARAPSNMYLQQMFFSMNVFHRMLFKTNSRPVSFIQRNEHVEMNNFSCSLPCNGLSILCF